MALTKVQADGVNLGDTFAFTGTVSGVGGLVLLSTTTVTDAVGSISFDNLSTSYDTFYVDYSLHPATDNVNARVNFLNSSGTAVTSSNYAQTAVLMDNMTYVGSNSATHIPMNHTNMGNAEIEGISGYFYLRNRNYDNSVSDQFVTNMIGASNSVNTSGGENHNWYAGYLNNNTEVRGFRITFSSGNIDEGYARLYGVAK
jgi:hypothetical protein